MGFKRVLKPVLSMSVCAIALVIAVSCSSAPAPSSSSAAPSSSSSSAVQSSSSSASQQSSSASSASSATGQFTKEKAVAEGYQVFEGTVRVADAKELVDLQGVDIDPAMAGGNGTYAVLVFDQPTDVTGMLADGTGESTKSAKMLGIAEHTDYSSFVQEYGDLDLCKTLDGQHVTLAAMAKNIMFPSDVRLPLNEPSAKNVVLVS